MLAVRSDICCVVLFFFFQAEDGIRDVAVTGVQTCALPICLLGRGDREGGSAGARGTRPARRGWTSRARVRRVGRRTAFPQGGGAVSRREAEAGRGRAAGITDRTPH